MTEIGMFLLGALSWGAAAWLLRDRDDTERCLLAVRASLASTEGMLPSVRIQEAREMANMTRQGNDAVFMFAWSAKARLAAHEHINAMAALWRVDGGEVRRG